VVGVTKNRTRAIRFLVIFVTLASHQNHIALCRPFNRVINGLGTVTNYQRTSRISHTTENMLHDFVPRFVTGIVICEDYAVSKLFGYFSHYWALTSIPVAATAKHAPDLPFKVISQRS
jgi:hypothetical protein